MQVGQCLVIPNALRQLLGSVHSNNIAIEKQFGQELLILKASRNLRDTRLAETQILQQNDSEGIVLDKSISYGSNTLVLNRIVIQVDLGKFVFVAEDFTQLLGALLSDVIAFEVE